MKRPALTKPNLLSIAKVICAGVCLASLFLFGGATWAQSPEKIILRSDKKSPRRPPEKSTQTTAAGAQQEDSTSTQAAPAATDDAPTGVQTASSPSGCVFNTILVKDTIRVVFVELINFPTNTAVPVTVTQTNPGVVGYALTDAGPFNPTLNIVINTDGSGYGVSAPVFTQGQVVGQTVTYADTPYGPTDTINFNVLPQCNCPPIPVVQ